MAAVRFRYAALLSGYDFPIGTGIDVGMGQPCGPETGYAARHGVCVLKPLSIIGCVLD
jgi:hypothetical protein